MEVRPEYGLGYATFIHYSGRKNGFAQIRSLQICRKYVTEERIYGKDGKFKFAYQKQVGVGCK